MKFVSPVKKGEKLKVKIVDINHIGQGIAKIDGFVIFIDNAITEDFLEIEILEVKKNFAVGKILNFIEKSTYRDIPLCEFSGSCGGCQIMHMDYQNQLIYKKQRIINEFKKASFNIDFKINDTIGMDNPFRYRNKGSFPIGNKDGKVVIGPFKVKSHEIVDVNSCHIQHEKADDIIRIFKSIMEQFKLKPYDEKKDIGLIKHLMIRSNKKNEIMLIIVTNGNKLPYINEIVNIFRTNIDKIKTIVQNINSKKTNVILGNKNKILYGNGTLKDTIGDLTFKISPHTFFQVNSTQTEKLYNKVIEYASSTGEESVFDIYCGIGTISLMAARKAKKVYGVEIVEQSIENAKENAKVNSIENVEFYTGKAEEVVPKMYKQNIRADVVIVDPPRKGCENEVLETIIKMNPKRVIYVSCNPATLVRDLKILCNEGEFKIAEVQPVDMFPHTTHTETVLLLQKK